MLLVARWQKIDVWDSNCQLPLMMAFTRSLHPKPQYHVATSVQSLACMQKRSLQFQVAVCESEYLFGDPNVAKLRHSPDGKRVLSESLTDYSLGICYQSLRSQTFFLFIVDGCEVDKIVVRVCDGRVPSISALTRSTFPGYQHYVATSVRISSGIQKLSLPFETAFCT